MARILISKEPGGFMATNDIMEQLAEKLGLKVVYSEYSNRDSYARDTSHPFHRAAFFLVPNNKVLLSNRRLLEFRHTKELHEIWNELQDRYWQESSSSILRGVLENRPLFSLKEVVLPDTIKFRLTLKKDIEVIVEDHRTWSAQ